MGRRDYDDYYDERPRSRRRNNTSGNRRKNAGTGRKNKRSREDRIERFTWFLLVLVFAIIYILPEDVTLPNWLVPLAGAVILLGSGFYQSTQRMRVGAVTWLAGSLMATMSLYGLYINSQRDMIGFTLVVFAGVIGVGMVTGET
ncbi:MAG: hypothetical protein H7Y11_00035 [Armatimonadetes bacterium]|nr:hypothetical protein [Anaerolineae bacterium]